MEILLASSNPHKVGEIAAVWEQLRRGNPDALSITLRGLDSLKRTIPEPVEDQPTFEDNAVLKARYYAKKTKMPCLADDSGLEVDALGGEPGVRSARYAGITGPRNIVDPANNRLLMEKLDELPSEQRTARFVCVMALCAPPLRSTQFAIHVVPPQKRISLLATTHGTIEGRILTRAEANPQPDGSYPGRGTNGFGYDPLFLVSALGKTTAELTPEQKNQISHRGQAARLMWAILTKANI